MLSFCTILCDISDGIISLPKKINKKMGARGPGPHQFGVYAVNILKFHKI